MKSRSSSRASFQVQKQVQRASFFVFNCLNRSRQLYRAEPYAWLTLYMPNYGMRGGQSVRPEFNACPMTQGFDKVRTRDLGRDGRAFWSYQVLALTPTPIHLGLDDPSSARFNSRTLTCGSPRTPNWRAWMCACTRFSTASLERCRAAATRET
jgi:hypothetical protein